MNNYTEESQYIKEFIYDGTFEGLLTAIFFAYKEKQQTKITSKDNYIPNMLSQITNIETDSSLYQRVYTSIKQKLNNTVLSNVYLVYLSETEGFEDLILKYLKLCYKHGTSINLAKNNDIIILIDRYVKRVNYEAERFRQFVRFKEITPLNFYAKIEPIYNILPLIIDHFTERYNDQSFIIHDLKRECALVYDKTSACIAPLPRSKSKEILSLNNDNTFEDLFRVFYKSVTIEERINIKCRNSFMPKRYHKNMTELTKDIVN